jgi:hypothetical protein
MILPLLQAHGQLDVKIDKRDYLLQYVKIPKTEYINFYAWDITEKNLIERKSYDNFFRLNNFLESTDEAYYIIYNSYKEKIYLPHSGDIFMDSTPVNSQMPSKSEEHMFKRIERRL